MTMHENTLRLRHMEIERGPEMFRLYNFRCEHCLAWSADMCSLPCCDNCGSMVCKDCITASSWQEPDEGYWGGGECVRCARFTTNTRTRMVWLDPFSIDLPCDAGRFLPLWFSDSACFRLELGAPIEPMYGFVIPIPERAA